MACIVWKIREPHAPFRRRVDYLFHHRFKLLKKIFEFILNVDSSYAFYLPDLRILNAVDQSDFYSIVTFAFSKYM